ncbi:aftiphilin [Cheilinus undulatus]|uniref:aftiphilin n=1 Tax=Cheilinus undulatus TaxID=241271 RepID=UPI001BD2C91A|nr:aftiphilin [Cheilinus undulatus]XP_041644663.1 aftiphilin [Cheilinus undulatus]
MEPHILSLYSSAPPPLDDDGDEAGSEEDKFRDFREFSVGESCASSGFDDSTTPPPRLRYSSPEVKLASHQPSCSSNHPVDEYTPTSTVISGSGMDVEKQGCDAESHVHLTNGYSERDFNSAVSAGDASSPCEETGFADFTVFTEQAANPWCCGFTPLVGMEEKTFSNSLGKQICDPEQEIIMESEPRSYCKLKAKENVCTIKHCEKRDAALMQPSQDQQQPQEAAAAALDFPSEPPHSGEKDLGHPEDIRDSLDYLSTTGMQEDGEPDEGREDQEKSFSILSQTFSMCGSVSDASFCDDFSFECPSADLEPNVSSLGSPDDQTDWDQTDDEEELENFQLDSLSNNTANPMDPNTGKGSQYLDQSAPQETSATSQSESHTEDKFADFKDSGFAPHRKQGHVQTADAGVQLLGNLPPSDSFADFCSAPTRESWEESWADFKDLGAQEECKTWTQSQEQVSSLKRDWDTEEEQDREGQCVETKRNSYQTLLSGRVQQLFLTSFPEVEVPAVEDDEVLSLAAQLHKWQPPVNEEEDTAKLCPTSQWIQLGIRWPYQDVHSAVGLKFQWGGSHTNRALLRCLDVDTRNIVFIGMKKQPVTVPAFASSLGMLEPTKDSAPADYSPGHAVMSQAFLEPQVTSAPLTDSLQEALPSSQLDWSRSGLTSSQDDCSALNLDYFGPEEESASFNSSDNIRSNSPPPGVDRELYELTISKLETSNTSSHMEDTLNRLMSTAEKTTTSIRKPQQDKELSVEASRVISGLPNLSFMRARVLMFPAVLVPKESCPPNL